MASSILVLPTPLFPVKQLILLDNSKYFDLIFLKFEICNFFKNI